MNYDTIKNLIIVFLTVCIVGLGIEYAMVKQENADLEKNVIQLNKQKWELFDKVEELQE